MEQYPRAVVLCSCRRCTSPALRKLYDLELVAPNGQVIEPGATVGGLGIQYLRRHTYTIYKVVLPDAEDTAEYLGDWVLRLTPRGNWDPRAVGTESSNSGRTLSFLHVNPTTGLVPIGFAAAVASNYRMQVEVLPTSHLPGAAVIVRASFVDKGWPAPAGRAMVDVTTPNGTLAETISLRDDGVQPDAVRGDGSFAGQFFQTGARGSYRFRFRGLGRNASGELAPREATRYVTLMPRTESSPTVPPCIPCYLSRVLIVVFALLVLWLLWAVHRRP